MTKQPLSPKAARAIIGRHREELVPAVQQGATVPRAVLRDVRKELKEEGQGLVARHKATRRLKEAPERARSQGDGLAAGADGLGELAAEAVFELLVGLLMDG